MQGDPENLRYFSDEIRRLRELDQVNRSSFDGGGGGGYDGPMEARVKKLEDDLLAIKTDVAVIRSNYLTKHDLAEAMSAQVKWIVGTAIVLGGLALTIMTFVLNNAIPKAPTTPPAQLVIPLQLQAPTAPAQSMPTPPAVAPPKQRP